MKKKNSVWAFFASVKLAIFTFFVLAATSIIGTIIPQGKEFGFYVLNFGPTVAKIFQVMDVPNMYNSFWFLSFLVLFSINLTVCTIDRFPNIWRLVVMDNMAIGLDRIVKMPKRMNMFSGKSVTDTVAFVQDILAASPWSAAKAEKGDGILFFAQKGAWTRLGVIGVHVSILVIFTGAIIGSIWGQKGGVMLPEGAAPISSIYAYDGHNTKIPLGFEIRCDKFELAYYASGAPREYRSLLTVLKGGEEVLTKSIVVNDPLDYDGFTFYQSSYRAIDNNYVIEIENEDSGEESKFYVVPRQQYKWPEKGLTFGIVNRQGPFMGGQYRHKIWFSDGKGSPSQFWANEGQAYEVIRSDTKYKVTIRGLFATGLQIAKDPGVWWVYAGCMMMLLGLYVAFFFSHKRVWVYVAEEDGRVKVVVSGNSNKNKVGFANEFEDLIAKFDGNENLNFTKE